ncbi:MAG: putative dinucleotide-binding enzyme [Chloroflexi bacterium]|nr:putative dinucleotide-binding enzyme [Chloroflexota bacterium]
MSDVTVIGGAGHEGYGLALRWALAGKSITIGSRSPERAMEAAQKIKHTAAGFGKTVTVDGQENAAAAASAPVVVVSVPLAAQIATIKAIREHLQPSCLLVDVTVPLATAIGGRASRMLGLPAGSAAEQLAEYAPAGVQVVSAFHFLSADLLAQAGPDGPIPIDCDVVACGGDAHAQEVVRELAVAIEGVHYFHAGPLVASRLVEAAATMLIAMNVRHKVRHTGIRITGHHG